MLNDDVIHVIYTFNADHRPQWEIVMRSLENYWFWKRRFTEDENEVIDLNFWKYIKNGQRKEFYKKMFQVEWF